MNYLYINSEISIMLTQLQW